MSSCSPISRIRCWKFVVSCVMSFIALTVAVLGFCGVFPHGDFNYYSGLFGFIIGVWLPRPHISDNKGISRIDEVSTDE